MMNNIERGKEIFLAQLKEMLDGYKKMEEWQLDDNTPVIQAEAFGVPEELREAFYAYHAEFLTDHETSTNTSGPFYNDEDVNKGVRNKFWYFYWPIVKLLEDKYPDFQFRLTIEPHYEDSSTILVIGENRYGKNILPFPVVVLWEYVKVWCVQFERPEEHGEVFAFLFSTYRCIEQVCNWALGIFENDNKKHQSMQLAPIFEGGVKLI